MMGVIRRGRRQGWIIGVAMAALAAVAPPPAAAELSAMTSAVAALVPGESIGPAHLGMTMSAAASALGPSVGLGADRWMYPRFNLVVDFKDGVAVRIATTSAKYRTEGGAGVGTAASDAARLINDVNSIATTSGEDTTILYAFQGVGLVFRGGRAVEAFVTAAISFGGPKKNEIVPVNPAGPPIPVPAGPPSNAGTTTPAGPSPTGTTTPAGTPAAGAPTAVLRDVTANVLSVGGLAVSGSAANVGRAPAGFLLVTARFTRASGDEVDGRTSIGTPLAPGGSAPFELQTAAVLDIIIRYQVFLSTATGALLDETKPEAVPPAAYAEFAQRQIQVKVDLGAPFQMSGPPRVQALVSVIGTGAIPAAWVHQVTVTVPYVSNGQPGSMTVQLAPGEMQTVLVPATATLGAPQVSGVVLGGQ